MRCPHCDFDSKELVCPQCRQRFGSAALEELSHLDYLESLLQAWLHNGSVARATHDRLRRNVMARRARLREGLSVAVTVEAAPKPPPEAAPVAEAVAPGPAEPAPAPAPVFVPKAAPRAAPAPPRPAKPRPALPPPPVRVARAITPFLSKYGLVSIPYLGVALLVGALSIGLYSIWSEIPSAVRLLIFVVATVVAFGGAYWLRTAVRLPITAAAVSLIGGALIAVDGFTVAGKGLLGLEGVDQWLAVSLTTAIGYALVAAVQRDLPFGFLTVGAVGSAFLGLLNVAGLDAQWQAGALTALIGASLMVTPSLRRYLPNVAEPLWWSARASLPIVMAGTLAWNRGLEAFNFMKEPASDYATGLVWWLGSAIYYASWSKTRFAALEHAAAWAIAISYTLTMYLVAPSTAWLGPLLLPLAAAYVLYGRYVRSWVLRFVPPATAAKGAPWPIPDFLRELQPAYLVGYLAIGAALLWPEQTATTRTVTLCCTAALWAGSGYLFPRLAGLHEHFTVWTAIAAAATFQAGPQSAWLSLPNVALGGVALVYDALIRPRLLPIGKAEPWTLAWVARASSRLSPAFLVGHAVLLLAIAWPWQTPDSRFVTLFAVAAVWVAGVRLYPRYGLPYEYAAVGTGASAIMLSLFETSIDRGWIGVAGVGLGAMLFLVARFGRRVLAPNRPPSFLEDAEATPRTLAYLPPAFIAGNALLAVALAWPWQTTDTRIATLLAVALTGALAAGLFPRLFRWYEVAAVGLSVAGLALTLDTLQERTRLDGEWAGGLLVPASMALLAFAAYLRPRLLRRLGVTGDDGVWTSPEGLAAAGLAAAAFAAPWAELDFNLGRAVSGFAVATEAGLFSLLSRRSEAHYATAAVLTAAFAETLALRGVSLNDTALWLLIPMGAFALLGEGMQAWRIRSGDAGARSAVPWQDFSAVRSLPYLASAYLLSIVVLFLVSIRLGIENEARVEFMGAYLGVAALWAVSSYLRRSSVFLVAAAPLAVVPYLLASDHGFFMGLEFRRVDLAWNLAVLTAIDLGIALLLDTAGSHYSKGFHATAFGVTLGALLWALPDRAVTVRVMGMDAVFYLVSAALVHAQWHPSFQWLADLVSRDRAGLVHRTFRSLFVYLTAGIVPVLALLTQSLYVQDPGAYGLTLSLLAPAYLGIGLAARRLSPDYQTPFACGAFAMAAVGPLVAAPHAVHRIAALSISIVTFAAHAPAYRNGRYLYLSAILAPVLMGLAYHAADVGFKFYGLGLVCLGYTYFSLGEVMHRWRARRPQPLEGWRWAYAEPFLVTSMAAVAVGLALTPQQGHEVIIAAFALGALFFLAPAVVYREALFLYGTTALAPVAYVVGLDLAGLEDRFFGPALLPGVALYLAISYTLARERPLVRSLGEALAWLGTREAPLLLPVLVATVALPAVSADDHIVLFGTLAASALVYLYAAWRFRSPLWLHPAVWAALASLVALIFGLQSGVSWARVAAYMVPATVLVQLAAVLVQRREGVVMRYHIELPVSPWSLPLQLAALATSLISLSLTAPAHVEGVAVAFALAGAAAAMAYWWQRAPLAWAAIILAAIGLGHATAAGGAEVAVGFAYVGLFAVVLALLLSLERSISSLFGERAWPAPARLWRQPLTLGAMLSAAIALLGSWGALAGLDYRREELQPFIATAALAGLAAANLAWVYRRLEAAYVALAALIGAGMLEMAFYEISQPLVYTAPAGAYLLALGLLERQRGDRMLGFPFEVAGIVVLMGSTLLQGAGWHPEGIGRFGYGAILFGQGTAVLFLGLVLRHRLSFFSGIGGTVIATGLLLADPVHNVWVTAWWAIVAALGAFAVAGYAFFEWRRQQLAATARDWLEVLDAWD